MIDFEAKAHEIVEGWQRNMPASQMLKVSIKYALREAYEAGRRDGEAHSLALLKESEEWESGRRGADSKLADPEVEAKLRSLIAKESKVCQRCGGSGDVTIEGVTCDCPECVALSAKDDKV